MRTSLFDVWEGRKWSLFGVIFGHPLDQSRMGVEIRQTDGRSRRTGRNRLGTYILVYGGVKLASWGHFSGVKMGSNFHDPGGQILKVGGVKFHAVRGQIFMIREVKKK